MSDRQEDLSSLDPQIPFWRGREGGQTARTVLGIFAWWGSIGGGRDSPQTLSAPVPFAKGTDVFSFLANTPVHLFLEIKSRLFAGGLGVGGWEQAGRDSYQHSF